jgi:hypothetical protein
MNKTQARKLTDEIRETSGRLDQLLKRAYAEGAWKALGYEDWSSYIDGELAELPRKLRYDWRAYGQVNDALALHDVTVPGTMKAAKVRPHLAVVKAGTSKEEVEKLVEVAPAMEAEIQALVDDGEPVSRKKISQKYGVGQNAVQLSHQRAIGRSQMKWGTPTVPDREGSTIIQPSLAACNTESAIELIRKIDADLRVLLGGRYALSERDSNQLVQTLEGALAQLRKESA